MLKKFKNITKIKAIKAREILDSRGNPTVEVDLITKKGLFRSSVPSGVSRGKYEAVELRDNEKRYQGRGVLKAVRNVNEIIAPKLIGTNPVKQKEIDDLLIKLDGTKNKSKLGANALLSVSMAVCRAGAASKNIPLYQHISQLSETRPLTVLPKAGFLVIEGGAHAGNELDFQEFLIVVENKIFSKTLQMASEIYQELKNNIKKKYGGIATNVGDEGAFGSPIKFPEEALELILKTAKNLQYQDKIKIILDVAASQFYRDGKYKMRMGVFTKEGLLNYYLNLIQKYPILGIEDPFAEDDWEGWKRISNIKYQKLKILIIADDLTATNKERLIKGVKDNCANAIIIKLNQIGTISEAIECARIARGADWKIIVSHRAGETCDDFISDFAVGIGADFIKAGAPARGERVAKYNRLLRIEEELKKFK